MKSLTIDIGGTKIHAWVEGAPKKQSVYLETELGIQALTQQLHALFKQFESSEIDRVHISIPGKFVGRNNAIIAPNTAQQLSCFSGEMDNFNVEDCLRTVMQNAQVSFAHCPLKIENDAQFQMKWRLKEYGIEKLEGRTILYIGPGTGLGGGLCQILNGKINIYGDGHIYDILLNHPYTGKSVIAEDLISGRAVKTLTGHTAKEIAEDRTLWDQFKPELHIMHHSFLDLIEKIQLGKFQKHSQADMWPQEIVKLGQSIDHIIAGGSLGTKTPFSKLFAHPLRLN